MSDVSRADDATLPSMPLRSTRGLCALLYTSAAAAHLAACASTPVRPDMRSILEQCPPEARATVKRLGLRPIMEVELETITCTTALEEQCNAVNVKTGPMVGALRLDDGGLLRVTGQAKVFPDRVYISFDRVYPTPEGAPLPLCGVVLNDDTDRFGVTAHSALPPAKGLNIDPALVDHSPDATVLNFPVVYTYFQGPEGTFKPQR